MITGFAQSVEVCKPVFPSELENRDKDKVLAPVVQTLDSAIHRINHYPLDKYLGNQLRYPLDRFLSGG